MYKIVFLLHIFSAFIVNKLVLLTGVHGYDFLTNSEVIDLEADNELCDDWTEFPRELAGSTGAQIPINGTNINM